MRLEHLAASVVTLAACASLASPARAQASDAGAPEGEEPARVAPPNAEGDATTEPPSEGPEGDEPKGAPSPPPIAAAEPSPILRAPSTEFRLRDYDAPDPSRTALDFARAAAYGAFVNYVVFQVDWFTQREYILVTGSALRQNFANGFAWDNDPLQTNFFGHPLHGSYYFAGARAAGLGFWESIPFSFAGSLAWELIGENERPSANDLAATSLGGVFLGEILHRISSQVLDDSKSGASRLGRELLATAINPVRGLDRVLTGKAWSTGLPPERRPMRVALNLGLDRVRLEDYGGVEGRRNLDPSLLAAFQIEYGDLRPAAGKDTLGPFETFDLYAAVNLFQANLTGAQVFEHGLLYGFSHDLTEDTDEGRDNNVFGFFQSFDFQGANLATFGALGVGPGEHLVYRTKNLGHIHVGLDIEWVPVFGLTSDNVGPSLRKYNIVTGGSAGLYADWDFGRPGRLQLRAKNYFGAIADGAQGFEYVGYTRLAYEIDILRGLMGVGLAPLTIQRGSRYREGPQESGTQASTQLYFVVHN